MRPSNTTLPVRVVVHFYGLAHARRVGTVRFDSRLSYKTEIASNRSTAAHAQLLNSVANAENLFS